MTHRPYFERAAHVLAAVVLACGLVASAPLAESAAGDHRPDRSARHRGVKRVPEGDVIARLFIPRLAVDLPILEGVGSRTLAQGPGHLPGTPMPGEEGTNHTIIAVPRDAGSHAIGELKIGDSVELRTPFGVRTYRVFQRRVIAPERIRVRATARPGLTFVTVYPADAVGPAPLRLAVLLEPSATIARDMRLERNASGLQTAASRPGSRQPVSASIKSVTRSTGRIARSEYTEPSPAFPEGR